MSVFQMKLGHLTPCLRYAIFISAAGGVMSGDVVSGV